MSYVKISCPTCHCNYSVDEKSRTNFELEWSNEFNAGYYSAEGYSVQENHSLFTKCIQCNNFFWKEEALQSKETQTNSIAEMLRVKPETTKNKIGLQKRESDPLFVEGSYDELLSKKLNPNKELYVRKKAWWNYCNYYRGISKMQYYPILRDKCLSTFSARFQYLLASLVNRAPKTPPNFQHYIDVMCMSRHEALNYWLASITTKMYITYSEDFEPEENRSPPEPEFTGNPKMSDLIFYEKERKNWEKANLPIQRDNLIRLIHLLDEHDSKHRLMKAEAMRQLGNFSECAELLKSVSTSIAATIKIEASKRNRKVLTNAFLKYE